MTVLRPETCVNSASGLWLCVCGYDLIVARIDIIGELDLGDRPKPIGAHADRHGDDPRFVDRRVEAARLAVLALQALGAAKHAAEIAYVLAEHDDALVLRHLAIHRVADRLDHRHPRHALRLQPNSRKNQSVPRTLTGRLTGLPKLDLIS